MDAYEQCLARKRLKEVDPDEAAATKELRDALQELRHAVRDFRGGDAGGVVSNVYFSMLHAGQGAIRTKGLRSTNLFSLIEALRHHYVPNGTVTEADLRFLQNAKEVSEMVQRGASVADESAQNYLEVACDFLYMIFRDVDLSGLDPEDVPNPDTHFQVQNGQ